MTLGKVTNIVLMKLSRSKVASVATLRLDRVKKPSSKSTWMLTSTEGGTVQGLNLAKPRLLPAVAPAQELSAFRALRVELKAFYGGAPDRAL